MGRFWEGSVKLSSQMISFGPVLFFHQNSECDDVLFFP